MKRFIEKELNAWKDDPDRKPLVLSGARQVGKSYVIEKNFASQFELTISINFEKKPEFKSCFKSDLDAQTIVRRIEALTNKRVINGKTLLFFDEIQACPDAITALRYFHEDMQALHVVAAGSLLEFTIEKLSVPVGRVTYRHLTPLSFEEFLYNSGNEILLEEIQNHPVEQVFPEALHSRAITLLKEYMAIGGMPEVVANYIACKDYIKCEEKLYDLLEAYSGDFPKYSKRFSNMKYIETVFARVPHLVGKQFKFVHLSRDIQAKFLTQGLELISKAGIVNYIYKTSGVPLGANFNPKRFKLLFLDLGLMQRACGLKIARWLTDDYSLINSGAVAEQFVGQQILSHSCFRKERLYYWERDKKGSSAEVDYLIERRNNIFPVEVKSGAAGKLRSIQQFLETFKDCEKGIKVSKDNFSCYGNIQSIPLYAFGSWLEQ